VVAASFTTGELRAFDASGRQIWQTLFPDFIPMRVREFAGGFAYEGERFEGGSRNHVTVTLLRVSQDYLLLQFGLTILGRNRLGDLSFATIDSRIVRIADGQVVSRQSNLPVLLAAGHGLALTAGGLPDLWVEIRRLTLSP
jgi:hypothetical protein